MKRQSAVFEDHTMIPMSQCLLPFAFGHSCCLYGGAPLSLSVAAFSTSTSSACLPRDFSDHLSAYPNMLSMSESLQMFLDFIRWTFSRCYPQLWQSPIFAQSRADCSFDSERLICYYYDGNALVADENPLNLYLPILIR